MRKGFAKPGCAKLQSLEPSALLTLLGELSADLGNDEQAVRARAQMDGFARFLRERLAPLADPRSMGEALKGAELGPFWKYRVGDYRLIASIEDCTVTVLFVRVGHRREIYR